MNSELNKRVLKAPNEIIPFSDPRIKWPMMGSIKYDGHRILGLCGTQFVTPSQKDHVNRDIAKAFAPFWTWCRERRLIIDAELWSPIRPFNDLQSILRTHGAILPDDIGLYVFDVIEESQWLGGQMLPYAARYNYMVERLSGGLFPRVFVVMQFLLRFPHEADRLYNDFLSDGHEGMMLRSPNAAYKHGRCTHLESHIYKFKEFITEDAFIVGFEQMRTLKAGVERTVGPDGMLQRSYRDSDYELIEALGSFVCTKDGTSTFKVKPGRGHTLADRAYWWQNRQGLSGQGVEFTHMPHGAKDAPRIGSLVRFRPDRNVSEIRPAQADSLSPTASGKA